MDLYLPAFPQLAEEFNVSATAVQWTLTADVIGLVAGQLVIGPLSDRWGRRRLVIVSSGVAAVGALFCALSPSIAWLIVWRFVQGLGGGGGMAIARAIAADVAKGAAAARLFSLFVTLSMIAPIIAPLLGGLLLSWTGSWRSAFVALVAISVVMTLALLVALPETLIRESRHVGGLRETAHVFRNLSRDRIFVGYTLTIVFSYAALFAYISTSSFALQEVYGLSPVGFSLLFAANSLGMIALGFVNARLVKFYRVRRVLNVGLIVAVVAGGTALAAALVPSSPLLVFLVPLFIFVMTRGMTSSNATVLGVERSRSYGSASAILGAGMFAGGIVVTPFLGVIPSNSAVSMTLVITVTALLAMVASLTLGRDRKTRAESASL